MAFLKSRLRKRNEVKQMTDVTEEYKKIMEKLSTDIGNQKGHRQIRRCQ